jgi:isochorismate hydrolase
MIDLMPTFDAAVEDYDPHQLVVQGLERDWQIDVFRAAVLIHDLLPYYVDVLPPRVGRAVVDECQRLVDWARANDVPVIASAPRPASSIDERGLGGSLWGLGPSRAETSTSSLTHLGDAVWVEKRSYSAFFATDLAVELRRRKRDQLLIAGVFASAGILATTFDALANDIQAFVVIEASADLTMAKHRLVLEQIRSTTGEVVSIASLGDIPAPPSHEH